MIVDELLCDFADRSRAPFPPPTASTRKCRRAVAVHGATPPPEPVAVDHRPRRMAALASFVAWVLSEASRVAYVDVPASRPFRNPAATPDRYDAERMRALFWSSGDGLPRSGKDRAQAEFLRDHPDFARFYRVASWRGRKIRRRLAA